MNKPLVSCIMPTANRQKYVPFAIDYFLKQDYENAELVIIDDGLKSSKDSIPQNPKINYSYHDPIGTIGIKRNFACEKAHGEIIMHWDDDDWYAPDWISRMTDTLLNSNADIAGLNRVLFYSPSIDKRYMYQDTDIDKPWLCGATMTYKKSFWKQHPFVDLQVGEDYDFVWNSGAKIVALDYTEGFIALLHAHNTSIKPVENPRHKKHATNWKASTEDNKI